MTLLESVRLESNYSDQLDGLYVPWHGRRFPDPQMVILNRTLASDLNLDPEILDSPEGASFLAGSTLPPDSSPLAQVYAGHQFGGYAPVLGDGRALLVGELRDKSGKLFDLHLKGSGPTPFSRGGDGKAALGPVLREYLIAEAMHSLAIPTSRALAAVTTGERIMREAFVPGAVLARIASSHLRVGTFQFFAAHGDQDKLTRLADYAIQRHYPHLSNSEDKYFGLLLAVAERQASLVAKWVAIGFVHGVMNTDNTTISGETIDYGPCAFIDEYDPGAVFSSIDSQGRYSLGNQPLIAQWNLTRFAESLLPLIDDEDRPKVIARAEAILNTVPDLYSEYWLREMRAKLGLSIEEQGDMQLAKDLHALLIDQHVDYTQLFRALASALRKDIRKLQALFDEPETPNDWFKKWRNRLNAEPSTYDEIADAMDRKNPVYIPRNHLVEEALSAAVQNSDLEPFRNLLNRITNPFDRKEGFERYEKAAPENFGRYVTYCGT